MNGRPGVQLFAKGVRDSSSDTTPINAECYVLADCQGPANFNKVQEISSTCFLLLLCFQ